MLFKKWYVIVLVIAVLLGGVGGSVWLFNSSPSNTGRLDTENKKKFETIEELLSGSTEEIRIEAVDEDTAGVDINSKFKIYVDDHIDLSLNESSIRVIPEQTFSVDKVSRSEYTLRFEEALKNNSIYKIAVENEDQGIKISKAFQTRKAFRIIRTLPRNKATYVPIESGIEITFTHEGIGNPNAFFEITPKVKGTFETHKETVVFVPESLDYDTVYTVKLKKGIGLKNSSEVINEDYIFQFQTERKAETKNNKDFLNFSNRMYNYTSKEIPVLSVYTSKYYKDKELDIKLYRYDNENDFLNDLSKNDHQPFWAVKNHEKNRFDKSVLQETMSFRGKIYDMGSPWYKQVMVFPSSVEQGYYLVSASYKDKEYMTHMQVNDMSVYIMMGKEKSLAWVNDIGTGEPLSGVEVMGEGIILGISNEKGIAEFELSEENKENQHYITLLAKDRLPFITYIDSRPYLYMYEDAFTNIAEKYWSYLYLDRGMYLPTDTVQVWGVAKPRHDGRLKKLTAQIEKYTYNRYDERTSSVLVSKEVEVSPYGTYTCSLEYENFNPGSYYMTVKSDEEIINRRYFQVKKYTKPAYKIDVNTDKKALVLGESVNLDVQASFFEGSPVAGLKLYYRGYGWYDYLKTIEGNISCNSNGHVSIKFEPESTFENTDPISWQPKYISCMVNNAAAEEEEVYAYASFALFPRDIMIYGKGKVEPGRFVAEIESNKIVLDRLNNHDLHAYDMKNYKGDSVNIPLKGKLIERRWDKKEVGQYYDFINKVTRKKYRYYTVENVLDEFEIHTVNGRAVYELPYTNFLNHNSYFIEVIGNDQKNRAVKETIYLYQSYFNASQIENMDMAEEYSLKENNNKYKFKTEEKADLVMLKNGEEFEVSEKGRMLYMILKNGIQSADVVHDSKMSFEFAESYIPNAHVKMVYFDGVKVYNAGSLGLNYDYTEKELDIKITRDKDYYKPGDIVNMEIEVSDINGNPCESEVNISAVDEAFFAMRGQSVHTIGDLYSYVFGTGILSEYFSYKSNEQKPNFAECGEGGDEAGQRYDFKDNAYFGSIKTDKNGKGSLQFTLPHNLTSWRITYQGITKDLRAGSGRENINAKLPFFVNLIFNDIYLAQDQPGISLRVFGTELNQGDKVDYKVVLEGPNHQQTTYKAEGQAGNYSHIMLESLEPGNYFINVYAESGGLKDAVKKEFKVVENILETARTDYLDLAEGMEISNRINISGENAITELVFYNKEISRYYRTLNALYYSWGQRVDQVLSRKIAGEYLKKYFDKEYINDFEEDLSDYQIYDGGIALFSYDSSRPVLSAKVCSAAKATFDEVDLKSYFYNHIDDEKTTLLDLAACYWGLASLDEPVLLDIYKLLESEDISLEEKLYYGIALSEFGDDASAEKIYREVIEKYGEVVKPYVYLNAGSDRDENIKLTALCAIIGIKSDLLGHEELFQYVMDNSTDEILTNLERLIYITSKTPDTKKESSFSYDINNKSEKLEINGLDRYRLVLTGDELKGITFDDIKGDIELAVNYIGPVKELAEEGDSLVGIKRYYRVNGKATNTFTQSDIIDIELTLEFDQNAPDGYYEITDVLPSGFKYVQPFNRGERGDYNWGSVNGQKITFAYYYTPNSKQSKTIRYLARVIAPGKYTADSGVILHGKSRAHGFTEPSVITIVSAEE